MTNRSKENKTKAELWRDWIINLQNETGITNVELGERVCVCSSAVSQWRVARQCPSRAAQKLLRQVAEQEGIVKKTRFRRKSKK